MFKFQDKNCSEINSNSYPEKDKNRRKAIEAHLTSVQNQITVIHIYFKELGIILYSRDEIYGIMDVIGNINILTWLIMLYLGQHRTYH